MVVGVAGLFRAKFYRGNFIPGAVQGKSPVADLGEETPDGSKQ